jgi:hypothetical protein
VNKRQEKEEGYTVQLLLSPVQAGITLIAEKTPSRVHEASLDDAKPPLWE